MKGIHKSQKLFGQFLHLWSFLLLSTIGCFKACLPPFCLGTPKGTIKEFTSPLTQRSESWCVHLIPQLVQEFYPSPFTSEEPQEFLLVNPCSLRPFLSFVWQGNESFHGPLLCSSSPHPSSSSFSWIFMEHVVLPFPPSLLNSRPLHHEAPNQPWFRCDYQLLHSGILLLLLLVLYFYLALGSTTTCVLGNKSFEAICLQMFTSFECLRRIHSWP